MIGQKLSDRYEIVDELGRGGMGVVYRARDPMLNRDVAVKVISPQLLTPESEQRFQAEAQLVAQLDHPSIVSIHDFGRHEGSLFFVMPVVRGTSLRQLIREQSMRLGEIVDVGVEVAEALDYSHKHTVIHRDIKPENVMVERGEGSVRVRVMDFGLARGSDISHITKTGTLVGTMAYLSPEQVLGKAADARSDVYSLGTVLYECVSQNLPFTGEMQSVLYRIVHDLPQPPREMGADIDIELESIILSCLAKDSGKRPQTAEELAGSLRRYRSSLRDSERYKSVMITRTIHAQRPALSPFVGRENELHELVQRLNTAVRGECQFVVAAGEAGVGKTRLLDELENLARAREIRVLHGRFVEQDGSFPYYGFCEAIQEYFQQKEAGSSSSGLPDLSDLGADLISLFPMLSEIEPIRSAASGDSRMAEAAEARSPENRTQIFELLARTLTRLAGGKPLLLLFEELHGADVSIEALQYIVRRLGPTPTLVVATYRSTDVDKRHPLTRMLEGFESDRRFSALTLGSFTPKEHRDFLSTLIGGSEIVDELAQKLFEGSDGNPFFTKELVRSLLDAGNLVQDDTGSWALSGGMEISPDALPNTIQQAVEKRIGRLPDDLRAILSVASVMGRTFDFDDLEALADSDTDLDDAVDRLVQEGLIEEERQSRGDRLMFSSGIVREVLYGELSRRKRRSLHRKYAAQLEKRNKGRLERVYPQLVYHFGEGDVPEKTVEYGLLHAKKSLEAFSPDEAIRSVKAALEFLDEEWEGDRALEGRARLLLAEGHQMTASVGDALKELEGAIRVFDREKQPEQTVEALLAGARAAWQARQTQETRRWVDRGVAAARAAGATENLGQLLSLAATVANLRGEYGKAGEYLEEAELLGAGTAAAEAKEEIPRGGKLVVGYANPIAAAEPDDMQLVEEWEVYTNAYETLLTTDDQGNAVPHLCEGWEAQQGSNSFLFTLRSGIQFQDGHELTADSIKRSFERSIRTPNGAPALAAIRGAADLAAGRTDDAAGIIVRAENVLEIQLENPLTIYPALLTDARASVARVPDDGGLLVGTGPFRLVSRDTERVVMERNPDYWKGVPPNLDAIEFRHGLSASAIADGLRKDELDLAGDLLPEDLEQILREPRFRGSLHETSQKIAFYVLFNSLSGSVAREPALRKALSGVVRPHELVWRTLGRFAQPAASFIPPGILGHEPGKRRSALSIEDAKEMLSAAGLAEPIRLQAAVHPLLQDRYAPLLTALLDVWSNLGVELTVATPDMDSYLEAWRSGEGIDVAIARWGPDYDDPDNYTYGLFHSATGLLRSYYSSAEADEILEAGRAESRPAARESLYRKFEKLLIDSGILIPLFHDVDNRIVSPRLRGVKLGSTPPYVNYRELGKAEATAAAVEVRGSQGGTISVPMTARLTSLDPSLTATMEQGEVIPCLYETLTRGVGEAQIVPWLAKKFSAEQGGKSYRFQLREGVRFHDGRRLTARDVRYSFERLLQNDKSESRGMYSPIRGAKAILEGKAGDLSGFHIRSATEFTIDLEKPVAFFPALISYSPAAIVPEGTEKVGTSQREGIIGTGPFRAIRFDPGQRLELERNANYWRSGYPKSDALVFEFGVPPQDVVVGFRSGRYSVASDLFPADVEALRREAELSADYREAPRLTTYYAACNTQRGVLSDEAIRRKLARAVDVPGIVLSALGQLAIPAQGLIPPGLLGYEPGRRAHAPQGPTRAKGLDGLELSVGMHPVLRREYAAFFDSLAKAFGELGVKIIPATKTMAEFIEAESQGSVDLSIGRWNADYPDADTFAHMLHTREGFLGALCGTPEIDELIDGGRAESEPEARHAIYRQLEERLAREARILPLFHDQVYRFARPEVDGLSVSYWVPSVAYDNLRIR